MAFFEEARHHTPYLGVETQSGAFVFSTGDRGVGLSLFVKRARPEFKSLRVAVTVLDVLCGREAIDGRQFVDVGANIGTSTIAALVSHQFGSAIACEPEEESYRLLQANLVLNGLESHVRPLRVGVSNRSGTADFVVTKERTGGSWIAIDPAKIAAAEAVRARRIAEDPTVLTAFQPRAPDEVAEMAVVDVELVTLDQLVESGVIDLNQVGMLWIDAEGHEGHILEGAGALAERGVPLVVEFNPGGLDQRGDRDKVQEVAERCYTHFVDVRRREPDPTQKRFRLRPVTELSSHADWFLDPSTPGRFTDLLLLRLDRRQLSIGARLPELVYPRIWPPEQPPAGSRAHPDQAIVAFVHIPKTAGATVRSMLTRAYSEAGLHNAGNFLEAPRKWSEKRISRRPGGWESWQQRGGRLTTGHVPYCLFHEHLPEGTRYITFLREPVDRVLSHYYRHMEATPTRSTRRNRPLAATLEEALVEMNRPELNDLSTRLLCEDPWVEVLEERALEEAKANLRRFAFVGIQERFEQSVVLLQRTLGLDSVPYLSRNINTDRRPAIGEIPDEQRALIASRNRLDAELYRFARGLFEETIAAADDGLSGDVETLRARSAEEHERAIQAARDWLARELPFGTRRRAADLRSAARTAGVAVDALKEAISDASILIALSIESEHDADGHLVLTRAEEPATL